MTEQQLGEQWREMVKAERRRHAGWDGCAPAAYATDREMLLERDASVLDAIRGNPGKTANDIAEIIGLKPSKTRWAMDRLHRDGKIRKESAVIARERKMRVNVWFCVD